jgi:hypothetical protein
MVKVAVEELQWTEQILGEVPFPKETLKVAAGFGSGLTTRTSDGGPEIWAICDRGPNLKIEDACSIYGWSPPPEWKDADGAKLMPCPDEGPTLARIEIANGAVLLRETVRLRDGEGTPISGLPVPESGHAECEPVLDMAGQHIKPDPNGMDTEGLAALADGTFWVSEEYGPSLIRVKRDGEVLLRLFPKGGAPENAGFEVQDTLPGIAAKRHLNRGFEALAASPSNASLFVAFQSPLAHPSKEQHKQARHVRLWQLDPEGVVTAQYLYPLDDPDTFARDAEKGKVKRSDIKVCEIVALGEDRLLVLERASATSKIYRVDLDPALVLGREHLEMDTRPTVEELSAGGEPLPVLDKTLLFTADEWPVVGPDIEGMTMVDQHTLLIVSDNDFGCEGKQTRFYRLSFDAPL